MPQGIPRGSMCTMGMGMSKCALITVGKAIAFILNYGFTLNEA